MLGQWATRFSAFWAVAAFAFVSQTIVTAIAICLATITLIPTHQHGVALAASVFDVGVLALFLGAIGSRRVSLTRRSLNIGILLSSAIAFIAAVLSIYLFTRTLQQHDRRHSHALASAGAAFWTMAFTLELGCFVYLLWPQTRQEPIPPMEVLADWASPVKLVKSPMSVHLAQLTPPPPPRFSRSKTEPYSPTDSGYAPSPKSSSFRKSWNLALRPTSSQQMGLSRARLLSHPFTSSDNLHSLYSTRRGSLETIRQPDGFETWDTSAVQEDFMESPAMHKQKLRLDSIPGSRPVSAAKPLDGPFPATRFSPEETPLPESPLHSPLSPTFSDTGSMRGFELPSLRRPSSSSHIHPLFRPECPTPPPLASPSTVILASPFAGQVITPEQATRPGLFIPIGSRPGSMKSRACSVRSFAMQTNSPVEPPLPSLP